MLSLLHAFLSNDIERFRSVLRQDGDTHSSRSGAKSKANPRLDVNAVDHLGRTILHLAASAGQAEYVEALLDHQDLDLLKADRESNWTALHRALYAGHARIAQAIISHRQVRATATKSLLERSDFESNSAFDVYNSTINGVNPPSYQCASGGSDFFSFGSNANHTLGFSDADDRATPERVNVKLAFRKGDGTNKFRENRIRDVQMSKYHTLVITNNITSNLLSCGFNKNGRLGIEGGTQFTLQPVPIPGQVVVVSAAQDHSLAVTESGDVYSWGSQQQGQLGYELEPPLSFSSSPRKIMRLAKEFVIGACSSATHSVCFTRTALFTWGENNGQIGHRCDRSEDKIIRDPRKVTCLSDAVESVTATRYATVCLLVNHEVIVLTNCGYFKLALQLDQFATQYSVFRPRQSYAPSKIVKVVSGSATIGLITNMGDVFSFVLDESTASIRPSALAKQVRPVKVWSLRRKHNAIRDCSIGQEGTVIVCTEGGSVFVGTKRTGKPRPDSNKAEYKFSRVAGITRIVQVRASEHGAFGLIRNDVLLNDIKPRSASLCRDLVSITPYRDLVVPEGTSDLPQPHNTPQGPNRTSAVDYDETASGFDSRMCRLLRDFSHEAWTLDQWDHDLFLNVNKFHFGAHRLICCARSPSIKSCIFGVNANRMIEVRDQDGKMAVVIQDKTIQPQSLVIIMHWIYTDVLLSPIRTSLHAESLVWHGTLKLASILALKPLDEVLKKQLVNQPPPTLYNDIATLRTDPHLRSLADVTLQLADGSITTHSPILVARSEFFKAMMSDAWISDRRARSMSSTVEVDLKHFTLEVMNLVVEHMFADGDTELFSGVDLANLDAFLDLVLAVLAAATELLLPRLKEICQSILQRHVHRKTVCLILHEADLYSAGQLKEACLDYCSKNLQQLLENDLLGNLSDALMSDLERHILKMQLQRLPVSKSGELLTELVQRHPEVLEASSKAKKAYLRGLEIKGSLFGTLGTRRPFLEQRNSSWEGKPERKAGKRIVSESKSSTESHMIFQMDDYDASELASEVSGLGVTTQDTNGTHAPSMRPAATKTGESDPFTVVSSRRLPSWAKADQAGPVIDLRSALRELALGTSNHSSPIGSLPRPRVSQRDRRKQEMITRSNEAKSRSPLAERSTPWHEVSPIIAVSLSAAVGGKTSQAGSNVVVPARSGCIVTPTRQPIQVSSQHNNASHGGHSRSYVSPITTPSSLQNVTSLADIIAAEETTKTQIKAYTAKRSMRDIQEQEAFEQWFQEESLRVQREEEASAALAARLSKSPANSKSKKSSDKKGRRTKAVY